MKELRTILANREVGQLRYSRLRELMEPFGYTFTKHTFDCGERVYISGPNLTFAVNDRADADCSDSFSASGLLMARLIHTGIVSEAVLDNLFNGGDNGGDYDG